MKNIKYIVSLIVLMMIGIGVSAQQRYFDERYVYTQHFTNPVFVNPGATGINGYSQVLFNYRNKWATFPGSPKTITFSYDGPLADRLSIGALVLTDENGVLETTKGQLSFAYGIESPSNKVSFGLSLEYIQHKVASGTLNNELINIQDALVLNRLDGNAFFDVSFGVYGVYQDKFKYGIAVPALIDSKLSDEDQDSIGREQGYIFNFGYSHYMADKDIRVEPSIWVKKLMFVPTFVDVNVLLEFLEGDLRGGLTYGIGADERWGFLVGTRVNNLRLDYSYNISRNEFQDFNNGSHEFTIGLNIGRDKKMMTVQGTEM